MKNLEKEIKRYLSEVKKNLICSRKTKKPILSSVSSSVYDYIEENNVQDIESIYTHFGTPLEIAEIYLPEPDIKAIKRNVVLKRIILAVLICFLAYLVFFLTGMLIDHYINRGNYTTYQIIEDIEHSTEDCLYNQECGENVCQQ